MQLRFQISLACAGLTAFVGAGEAQELPVPCVASCGAAGPSSFVTSGRANYVINGNVGTINQQSERAVLNWQSFNIGGGNTVNFQQPSASSAALNRIFQNDPSRIFGALNANGQVFLINQNGIVFGQGAQVDTGALTASTLNVADDVFNDIGIAGAINLQRAAFDGGSNPEASIQILEGANLKADQRILVIAPNIENRGKIATPGGQTILAASQDRVYLASDQELRGFLVEVDTGGSVANLGEIVAERGNVTLAGLAVNQSGRMSATTSASLNGSIHLFARDRASAVALPSGGFAPQASRAGSLTFGENSVTAVLPELDSTETAVDGQAQPLSRISGMGRTIEVQSGAHLVVPGGTVNLQATTQPANPGSGTDPTARIHLAAGSVIDVSGDESAVVAMERNQGRIKLFGNELAEAPVQRDGPLARQEIAVDLREGTAITDISRLREDIKRGVGERLSVGGTVTLGSEGDVVMQSGSLVDFAGGQVRYLDGYIETTQLLTPDGKVVDISDADPSAQYASFFGIGQVSHQKWGITESFRTLGSGLGSGEFHAGYVEGKDAGSLNVTGTGGVVLNGTLRGEATAGTLQRDAHSAAAVGLNRSFTEIPLGGLLSVNAGRLGVLDCDLLFATVPSTTSFDFDTPLTADLPIVISTQQLNAGGINRVQASVTGAALLPEDVQLSLASGGELSLTANSVQIDGGIHIPSGSVSIASRIDGSDLGSITVAETAAIDVHGTWVNDHPLANGGVPGAAPVFIDGGTVAITSRGDLTLAEGSVIDVSAGARLTAAGDLDAGSAGAISLTSVIPDQSVATTLSLGAELRGYGFDEGGALRLSAASFLISDSIPDGTALSGQVTLAPSFFESGGFGSFHLTADRGDLTVDAGTSVRISPRSLQLNDNHRARATGTDIRELTGTTQLLDFQRAPTTFSGTVRRAAGVGSDQAVLRIGASASIATELGSSIALTSDTDLFVDGQLSAAGGDISLTLDNPLFANESGYRADQGIWLGNNARLDASGGVRVATDQFGHRRGEVLGGGQITVDARRGAVVTRPGSIIDVSGAQQILDLPGDALGQLLPTAVASDAGSISIRTAESALLFGDLRGNAGGSGAAGGSFDVVVNEGTRDPNGVRTNPAFSNLSQFQYGPREIRVVDTLAGDIAEGTEIPAFVNGQTTVAADRLQGGGFDTVDLTVREFTTQQGVNVTSPGIVRFDSDVSLTAGRRVSLNAGVIASSGSAASVSAPYLSIGLPTAALPSLATAPATGGGRLSVDAEYIDLRGATVFTGFAQGGATPALSFASQGDIRMIGDRLGGATPAGPNDNNVGSLTSLADIELTARQIYPATLTEYSINVLGDDGRILVTGGDATAATPLSAAGVLRLSASEIVQDGVLRAPFGTIELDAAERLELTAGSLTSTSGAGAIVPFGSIELGADWVYSFGTSTRVLNGTPQKNVILDAPDVTLAAGSIVDISGGGDLLTYEFVKGPGGSRDILLGDNPEDAFAIVPTLGTQFGAIDPFESPSAAIEVGSTITLAGGSGVPAGEYAVLPARYAMLPGAYLIRPVAGTGDIQPSSAQLLPDGTTIVAGRRGYAGNDVQDSRWSGFAVLDGVQVRQRSEFNEHLASDFFEELGAVPGNAGQLTIDADRSIRIDGSLAASVTDGGRAAQVDFVADNIAIVDARTGATDRTELVDTELQNFAAASLLLGGSRRNVDDGIQLQISAGDVRAEDGADLTAAEIILAATDTVTVARGASLSGAGAVPGDDSDSDRAYRIAGDAAFVRVSAGEQVAVERTGATGQSGSVVVEEGATVAADGSINLEASSGVMSAGDLLAAGGSLSLTASLISLGDAPTTTSGLVLSSADLARFQAGELLLNSRSTIDLYGTVAADLNRVGLDAAGLRGFDNGGASAVAISARDLSLRNSTGASTATLGNGTGALALHAATLTLDHGNVDISGFASTSLTASRELVGNGESGVRAHGDLVIETPRLTGGMGADVSVTADGALTTIAMQAPADLAAATALGARMMLTGATITHGSRIETPSGIVSLHTTGLGGATLTSGSSIDVSGRNVDLLAATVGSSGGVVSVFADQGSVSIADGASIDVSGAASGGDAGRLTLRAAGEVQMASGATLQGNAATGETQGTFELDAGVLTNGFAALNSQLNGGGFNERRTLAVQTGDVTIGAGETVNARVFELTANGGSIDLAGRINSAAAQGGRVRLSARDDLALSSSAQIDARATGAGEQGGSVELGTLDGAITLAGGSTISVAGAQANGHVRLRAPRIGADSVAIAPIAGTITGAGRIDIEAFRAYDASLIDNTLIGAVQADTAAYMANAATIESALGVGADARFHLLPGVEIGSAGDLTLANSWDLMDWRYEGEAGMLTLRAGGNLNVSQSLSDGFRTQFGEFLEDGFTFIPARDVVQTGSSWSYRLAAQVGSVVVGADTYVRTGAGDIDIVAGDDVVLSTGTSAIYTAGENRGTGGAIDPIDSEVVLRGDFLHNGGDVRIAAGGDVRGVSDQLLPLWMPRVAGEYPFYLTPQRSNVFPAAWAIDSSRFVQGVGALGGGDIRISAGGELDSMMVALPTTGQANAQDGSALSIAGGGDLSIDAGGDIRGGVYHLGRGDADIRSGGTITTASTGPGLLPVLQLGDARIAMQARKDLGIQTAFNTTVASQDPFQGLPDIYLFAAPETYFFTYADRSAVSLTTIAGNADLFATGDTLDSTDQPLSEAAMTIYPGTLTARSLQGDVRINDSLGLFPSPQGTLEVLAGGDITSTRTVTVNLSDADASLLPGVVNPTLSLTSPTALANLLGGHAPTPMHALDRQPVLIAARGTIGTDAARGSNSLTFDTSKQTRVFAGEDVSNLSLFVQHNADDDVTLVQAGRDITYPLARSPNGTFTSNSGIISIEGPGRVDLIAGRDVNFGVAQGVETVGDQRNPVLADSGADISIWTGNSTAPAYDAFIERYLQQSSSYSKELKAYVERFPRDPALSDFANFRALSRLQQRELVQHVFFAEIKKGGLSDFQAGFDAIATLFPKADDDKQRYQGNLTSFLSHIRTVDGGNIDLMVPNGTVNAGLASSGSISKPPGQLGIVAQREGDISAFVKSDFMVNASRVFSLDGGDVLIWSSEGDIDAGRGSRAALAIPPPITSVDQNGNVVVEFPPAISGSGIRTAVSTPGREAGDVFLFAPQGVVNAGDAGIASAGNLTIAATEVIGADNIDVAGVSVGVPTDTGGLGTSLAGVSSVASSASSTVDASVGEGQGDDESASKLADTALSWLEVFVVGLGEDACRQDDVECLKRQSPNN